MKSRLLGEISYDKEQLFLFLFLCLTAWRTVDNAKCAVSNSTKIMK